MARAAVRAAAALGGMTFASASCAEDYAGLFHALQTFSGHPLRPHFLGDADGCWARGFRFFTAAAEYTYDGANWLPEVYFGLCAPASCDEGHVEVSLAPMYLTLIFNAQGVDTRFVGLRAEAAELGAAAPLAGEVGGRLWLGLLAMLALLALAASAAERWAPGRVPDAGSASLPRGVEEFWTPTADRLPAVSLVRAVATCAVVAYHAFFLKRDLRAVTSMPLAARRVQHLCLIQTSVFNAMSAWLLHRSFLDAKPLLGKRPLAWVSWWATRLWHKVLRQGPAILLAFYIYHVALREAPQELRARQSHEAKRKLCGELRHLGTPECWNTFANWGILRDLQLDAVLATVLALWGILGDVLGVSIVVAGLAYLLHGLFENSLIDDNLLWSLQHRRLPEALAALLTSALLARAWPRGLATTRPRLALAAAVVLAAVTAEVDWRSSQGAEVALLSGERVEPPRRARWVCAVGFVPLTLATLLVLPADASWLRRCAAHWFWGPLGDQLSLAVLLGHNAVFQLVEGCVLVGPNWDYPFSWALWATGLSSVLVVSWAGGAVAHLFVLRPCAWLCRAALPHSLAAKGTARERP